MAVRHLPGSAGSIVAKETVLFRGHPMVRALHPTTIEVTKDGDLTERGECIIGVSADKGCLGLGEATKAAIRRKEAKIRITLVVGDSRFVVSARGDQGLELASGHEMVIRKSSFLSERTLAVHADFAAKDIPRPMVRLLTNSESVGRLEIEVS